MNPRKPEHTDPFAEAFLRRLGSHPEAAEFVLGGYFALKHYLDYRETGDVDAWWLSRLNSAALDAARKEFAETAAEFGYAVRERAWAETISLEATDGSRLAFSFQVAARTITLDSPVPSPWGRFPIETLDDNVASKMVALVQRGAPRDFIDIKRVVDAGLLTAERCWELWAAKNPGADIDQARLEVEIHLEAIEARMPLESLPAARRDEAARLRAWYHNEFAASRHRPKRGERRGDGEEAVE